MDASISSPCICSKFSFCLLLYGTLCLNLFDQNFVVLFPGSISKYRFLKWRTRLCSYLAKLTFQMRLNPSFSRHLSLSNLGMIVVEILCKLFCYFNNQFEIHSLGFICFKTNTTSSSKNRPTGIIGNVLSILDSSMLNNGIQFLNF